MMFDKEEFLFWLDVAVAVATLAACGSFLYMMWG